MSNANPYDQPSGPMMEQPAAKKNGWLFGCLIAAAVGIPIMLVCAGILTALMLPAVQAAREAARRMQCSNNMKQIALAMHNYHDVYGMLPPAYTVDDQGRPLHSWRTIILPFLEQGYLYDQVDFSKPWDDPANDAVRMMAIPTYYCPSSNLDPLMTTYVVIVDPDTAFPGPAQTEFRMVTDGLSNTVLVTETDRDRAVHWMSPQDIDLPTYVQTATNHQPVHLGGSNEAMADGAVYFRPVSLAPEIREAMATIAGGERIDPQAMGGF